MSAAPVPPAPTGGEKKKGIPAWMLIPILLVVVVVVLVLVPSGPRAGEKDKSDPKAQEKAP